ncbi:MAG: hypothetical protein HDS84_03970 [Bacteroidales bacterium]|nr:hypothetical protein [Bacteroidales bacterium]
MPRLIVATMYYGLCLPRRGTQRPYSRPVMNDVNTLLIYTPKKIKSSRLG